MFVELLADITENHPSFIRAYIEYDMSYTLAKTLEISDLFRVITAYCQQVTEDCTTLYPARVVLYNLLQFLFSCHLGYWFHIIYVLEG